ncbi:MAG: glycosyltransferase family 4 protein [Tepidisphaeraceae bacterium]|jgi:glycosyltransferase involved in cell wall biosynthesis
MSSPVFGFLAFTSGSYEGAILRDMRLANALHRRGFKVVVYWMMETNRELVDPGIVQRVLSRSLRYWRARPSGLLNALAKILDVYHPQRRRRFAQQHPNFVATLLRHFISAVCDGDDGAVRRLEKFMARDGVTHLLPTFVMTCPLALAVKQRGKHPFDYLATFQGEEIFANYAQVAGRLEDYYAQLRNSAAASGWPAVVVSNDYALRLRDEVGLDPARMKTIYPGIELPLAQAKPRFEILTEILPLRPDVPMVTYFGRQDSEKGIDLLLYATRMLRDRGVEFQLVICGGSSFGWSYQDVCKQIARHLRLHVFWKRRVSDAMRAALYAHSRCVVYPSIHREPFGMVAAETMSHGTPVIVPDHGGIMEVIGQGERVGGLSFKVWDTADLARQIERLIVDDALYGSLSAAAAQIAAQFSVEAMTDQVLAHLGLPKSPP